MPPKKMTKEEEKAFLIAEEERHRLEAIAAEEKRIEDERLQRIEDARLLAEQRLAFRIDEMNALSAEDEAGRVESIKIAALLAVEENEVAVDNSWRRHLLCDRLPDGRDESAVNTFISIAQQTEVVCSLMVPAIAASQDKI